MLTEFGYYVTFDNRKNLYCLERCKIRESYEILSVGLQVHLSVSPCLSVGRLVGLSLYISPFLYISLSVNVNANVDKDITHTVHLQSNTTSLELWIILFVTFLFLLVWCKQKN